MKRVTGRNVQQGVWRSMQLLTSPIDIRWFRDVHAHDLPAETRSVLLCGNEDSPDSAEAYRDVNPRFCDLPIAFYTAD